MPSILVPSTGAKNPAAYPYMGCPKLYGELEIIAHAHGELLNPIARGDEV